MSKMTLKGVYFADTSHSCMTITNINPNMLIPKKVKTILSFKCTDHLT